MLSWDERRDVSVRMEAAVSTAVNIYWRLSAVVKMMCPRTNAPAQARIMAWSIRLRRYRAQTVG